MTSPAVFFSRRARSLAACSTSSAMSRVVRMHQMLLHHASERQAGDLGAGESNLGIGYE